MIVVRLHATQALAILAALEGRRLGGKGKASLRRGIERLEAALGFAQMHPLDGTLDRLGDVMMDIRSRAAFERLWALLREVGELATLWSAVEELPVAARGGLLDLSALGDPAWSTRARAALAGVGLVVSFRAGEVDEGDDEATP
ncbi:MAG: hypothetical protein H6705_18865 [Myxococcales bacterium]|nr:hypothetical protein [Myxococcales bacterium]